MCDSKGEYQPQVHIVAYCTDLGFGRARGVEMLSLMLACGIASRWMSGWIFDVTGSYQAAFLNGMGWNLLNLCIVGGLYWRVRRRGAAPIRV